MKPEIKELWIEALLSGDYQQGQGRLHTKENNGTEYFCCLGVLTDLAIKNGVPLEIDVQSCDTGERRVLYNGCTEYLPLAVAEWAEVPTQGSYDLSVSWDGQVTTARTSLAEINDEGYTFEEIAEEIKAYF